MPQLCQDCGLWKCPGCGKCKTADEYHKRFAKPKPRSELRPRCKICTLVVSQEEKQRRKKALRKYHSSEKYRKKQQTIECRIKQHLGYLHYKENGGKEKIRKYHRLERVKQQHNEIVRRQYGTVKHKVRVAVQRAILKGLLPGAKTLNCCYCGNNAKQYHHPLIYKWKLRYCVIPVCTACHGKVHSKYFTPRPCLKEFAKD